MHQKITALIVLIALCLVQAPAEAAGWGSIKGRFVADGTPPKLKPLDVGTKDPYCTEKKPENDTVLVGKNNGLQNAVLYLRPGFGKKVEVHPDYEAKLKEPAVLDNNGCLFIPKVVTVRVGQPLLIKNSDPTGHNTNISLLAFNPIVPAGEKMEVTVSKDSPLPAPISCNIHPWMKAYAVMQQHPYMAVSGEDGTFEIKNIPAGSHEFQFWHEAPGYLKNLKFNGGTTDARGRAKINVAADKTLDLGDIKVPARILVVQ